MRRYEYAPDGVTLTKYTYTFDNGDISIDELRTAVASRRASFSTYRIHAASNGRLSYYAARRIADPHVRQL